jgi:potassium-dependent mechanosensitive channel
MLVRLLALVLALLAAVPAAGQESTAVPKPFSLLAAEWGQQINRSRAAIRRDRLTLAEIDRIGGDVDQVRQAAGRIRDEEQQKTESARGLLNALGPPPEAGAAPEPPDVAAKRRELNTQLSTVTGRVKQAELVLVEAEELLRAVAQARQSHFTSTVLARGPSPLSPAVWAAALPELGDALARLAASPLERWKAVGKEGVPTGQRLRDLLLAGSALMLAIAVGWPLRRLLLTRLGRDPRLAAPDYGRRVLAAGAGGIARGLIPSLAIATTALTLVAGDPSSLFAALVQSLAVAAVAVILVTTLAWAALAPEQPAWRILPVDDQAAHLLYHRIVLAMGIAAIDIAFFGIADAVGASLELRAVLPAVVDTGLAFVLLSLLPGRLWREAAPAPAALDQGLAESADAAHLPADAAPPTTAAPDSVAAPLAQQPAALGGRWWLIVRCLAALVALSVPFWSMFGYTRFASYLNNLLLQSGAAIALLLSLRLLASEAFMALLGRTDAPAPGDGVIATPAEPPRFRRWLALSDQAARYLEFWLLLIVDLALIVGGLIFAALVLGMRPGDLMSALGEAFTGFSIGKIRLSPVDIALGLLLFAVVLGISRLVQRFIDERVLKRTRVDAGVRNSLIAGIGYVGFFLAAVTAISTAGVDLSNLAIVAGALSVGIGFGLQNIVNNFVSGLILLVERPIKVGDIVSVNNREGQVKRISVRATEVETAKRASIIIPNSEILSSAVTNMTHKDSTGRVEISLGVAYGSDTEQVRKVLMACAEADYRVLRHPAPQVLFRNFGDSALEFELRCFVGSMGDTLWVPSDLRFAIDKAFREHGIEMPFPQRDVRIKDLDRLIERLPQSKSEPPRSAAAN